jgi:hypothetical protein
MKFIVIVFCLFFTTKISAQRCAVDEAPPAASASRAYDGGTSSEIKTRDTLKDEVITIPVVIHVLYNNDQQNISDQQILSQIEVLNKDYRRQNTDAKNTPDAFKSVAADVKIVFCLANVDPLGKPTTGIIRKYTKENSFSANDEMKSSATGGDEAWDATKYLNIWICNLSGNTLGYGLLPGSPAEKDGVVIKYTAFGTIGTVISPYNKGRTATHEIGHWLGLRHLWGDADCGDDGIADTPPQQTSNNYCPVFPHPSSCSVNSYGDMFMNFMDFTDDGCMNMFTQGQKNEMRSLFALGNSKNSFLNSAVCKSNTENAPLPGETDTLLITAYPNPFVNEINIVSKSATGINGKVVKLFSITGSLYLSQVIQSAKTTLHVNNLPSGVYLIKIEGGEKPLIYKLVK